MQPEIVNPSDKFEGDHEATSDDKKNIEVIPATIETVIIDGKNDLSEQIVEIKVENTGEYDFQKVVIDILNNKQDISLTDLSKEVTKKANRKLNNGAIENIIKDISELEE